MKGMKRLVVSGAAAIVVAFGVIVGAAILFPQPAEARPVGCGPVYGAGWFTDRWQYCDWGTGLFHCHKSWTDRLFSRPWTCERMAL